MNSSAMENGYCYFCFNYTDTPGHEYGCSLGRGDITLEEATEILYGPKDYIMQVSSQEASGPSGAGDKAYEGRTIRKEDPEDSRSFGWLLNLLLKR